MKTPTFRSLAAVAGLLALADGAWATPPPSPPTTTATLAAASEASSERPSGPDGEGEARDARAPAEVPAPDARTPPGPLQPEPPHPEPFEPGDDPPPSTPTGTAAVDSGAPPPGLVDAPAATTTATDARPGAPDETWAGRPADAEAGAPAPGPGAASERDDGATHAVPQAPVDPAPQDPLGPAAPTDGAPAGPEAPVAVARQNEPQDPLGPATPTDGAPAVCAPGATPPATDDDHEAAGDDLAAQDDGSLTSGTSEPMTPMVPDAPRDGDLAGPALDPELELTEPSFALEGPRPDLPADHSGMQQAPRAAVAPPIAAPAPRVPPSLDLPGLPRSRDRRSDAEASPTRPPRADTPRLDLRRRTYIRRHVDKKVDRSCRGLWKLPRLASLPFRVGEELGYELSVAGAYIGHFETKVGATRRVNGQRVLPLFGRARTTGFAKAFRPFVGRYMAMSEPERLLPVGLRVEATYDEDRRWERVRFEADHKLVKADFTIRGRRHHRQYTSHHELTDLLSVLFFARQVDVHEGLSACQHVFGARRLWRMTAKVAGSERLSTPAGHLEAWHVKVTFLRMPTPGLTNTNRPRYDMQVFLAKDDSRTPLAFVVDYHGITARGDLRRWSLRGKSEEESWRF